MKKILILSLLFFNLVASDAFITPNELKKSLDNKNILIIDVADSSMYKTSHISGAIHADISKFINLRNPYYLMNSPKIIQDELKKLGINIDSKVVIYSHNTKKGVLNSSYFAFILLYSGFENITILDGGYMAWVFENEHLTSSHSIKVKNNGNFIVKTNPNILSSSKYIQNNLSLIAMLDTRSPQEYYGTKRSDKVTSIGHIPHAKSSFYMDKFLRDGTIRDRNELDKIFIYGHELKTNDEVIVYGDSVFSASMEFYILYKHLGFKKAKLYEASLFEWGNNINLPIRRFKWE